MRDGSHPGLCEARQAAARSPSPSAQPAQDAPHSLSLAISHIVPVDHSTSHRRSKHTTQFRIPALSAHAINFLRNFLWNSVRSRSFTNLESHAEKPTISHTVSQQTTHSAVGLLLLRCLVDSPCLVLEDDLQCGKRDTGQRPELSPPSLDGDQTHVVVPPPLDTKGRRVDGRRGGCRRG